MNEKFKTEAEMAAHIVRYFQDLPGWSVYQEVRIEWGGKIADIVVTDGIRIWVICCKLSIPLGLFEQAVYWQREAHMVSIAVPFVRARDRGRAACLFLKQNGIGLFSISPIKGSVTEEVPPNIHRKIHAERLRSVLTDDILYRGVSAGDKNADFFTPFKSTVEGMKRLLEKHPDGLTMRQIIDGIGHHYGSDQAARCSLSKWITEGVIKGVVRTGKGRNTRYTLEVT